MSYMTDTENFWETMKNPDESNDSFSAYYFLVIKSINI